MTKKYKNIELSSENFFVDELDGKWTLGYDFGVEGTRTLCIFSENVDDVWFYPKDIGYDYVLQAYFNNHWGWEFNLYRLPCNWKDIVTQDKGKDGKKSIHDIMVLT